jgi:hypothetical protein
MIKYFKYICRHKWFVFLAGLKVKCSLYRLLVHDLSKFLPSEIFAYNKYFYSGCKCKGTVYNFNRAWLYHQHRNKHHWQYWILNEDNPEVPVYNICDSGGYNTNLHSTKHTVAIDLPQLDLIGNRENPDKYYEFISDMIKSANRWDAAILIDMPDCYIREMVADWAGAGRAITGKWEVCKWYEKNKQNVRLSEVTRMKVEEYLEVFK